MLSVSERTFNQEVLESDIPVLVNFGAPWCGLCRIIQPLFTEFKKQCGKEIKFVEINADENFKLSNTYKLKSLPTLLLIEEGIVKHRLDRFRTREDLLLALEVIKANYTKSFPTYNSIQLADLECRSA